MFSPDGPLTNLLQQLTGEIINVKNSPWGTRIVLILLQGWLGSSYVFLLCTGILQSIPGDLYEAANIDGATGFQQTRHITIPILLFQTAPLMIGQYTLTSITSRSFTCLTEEVPLNRANTETWPALPTS